MVSFALVVPTLNPGPLWSTWLSALNSQTVRPAQVLVIDSNSDAGQIGDLSAQGIELITIPRDTFNHGATRQDAFERVRMRVEVVIFMTQDALLSDKHSLANLVCAFDDPTVAAAYGRQLPHPEAGHFGAHARLFNYGGKSAVKQLADRDHLGIKACFLSNSFAAYRCCDLEAVGGFPVTDFGEDMLVAACLLLNGRRIAYMADACVYHSHEYSIMEEFRRYHATGQFHARHPWLLEAFGRASGEGWRFVQSEARYLLKHSPSLLPMAVVRTLAKYAGYAMGRKRKKG